MDATQRFSSRVDAYLKYRPHYPTAVIETLQSDCQLTADSVVADIGSGTGFLSELFLNNNNLVFAVEPNREMRLAGEAYCQDYSNFKSPNFKSIDGSAEATTLASQSVDFVVAGQAFHWFNRAKARQEFTRILRPGGWVMLVWNDRDIHATPFLAEYEQLLQTYCAEYPQVNHKNVHQSALNDLFEEQAWLEKVVTYQQLFDYEGLKGRLMSSSYAPEKGHRNHAPMLGRLSEIFHQYCSANGTEETARSITRDAARDAAENTTHESAQAFVKIEYKTRMFYGQLSAA